jgi:hypothetical protein
MDIEPLGEVVITPDLYLGHPGLKETYMLRLGVVFFRPFK